MKKRITLFSLMNLLMLTMLPQSFACSVCFGPADSPSVRGIALGILAMFLLLGVIFSVTAYFLVGFNRRAKLLQQ